MSETINDIVREMRDWWMRSDNEEADAELKSFANRIEAAVKVLEADRDNWRRQALAEDARVNAINFAANTNVDAKVYSKSEMIESVVKAATQAVQLTNEKFARPVGNAAAMREALETISKCDISKEEDCYILYRVCEAALSAPPRNCDIGTAEEQDWRFNDFCSHTGCNKCPLNKGVEECALGWAQLPYEKGEAK